MSTVQDVSNAWQGALGGAAQPAKGITQDAQDRFLKLLVTQMKNQDPLNPMDNAQVTSQMAQISTVSGVEKLNATLAALGGNLLNAQALSSADVIGRGVLVPGSTLTLDGTHAPLGIDLKGPADRVVVTIHDAAGRAVQTVNLGAQPAGVLNLAWDGATEAGPRASNGNYTFSVQAYAGSVAVEAHPLRHARVNAVTPGAQGMTLQLDRIGPAQLSDVKQIL
jgi:flagellar basal-body rod modification protein FlgD